MVIVAEQLEWAYQQIRENVCDLLVEAEHEAAAEKVAPKLLANALDSIKAHLSKEGDLRAKAVADNLIAA